jgi:hypothetical protein
VHYSNKYEVIKIGGELEAQDSSNLGWKEAISNKCGITLVHIKPIGKQYCLSLLYFGYAESAESVAVLILVNAKHDQIPFN